jgi:hypothetical protein
MLKIYQLTLIYFCLCVWYWGSNLGLCACKAGALTLELCPQPYQLNKTGYTT